MAHITTTRASRLQEILQLSEPAADQKMARPEDAGKTQVGLEEGCKLAGRGKLDLSRAPGCELTRRFTTGATLILYQQQVCTGAIISRDLRRQWREHEPRRKLATSASASAGHHKGTRRNNRSP